MNINPDAPQNPEILDEDNLPVAGDAVETVETAEAAEPVLVDAPDVPPDAILNAEPVQNAADPAAEEARQVEATLENVPDVVVNGEAVKTAEELAEEAAAIEAAKKAEAARMAQEMIEQAIKEGKLVVPGGATVNASPAVASAQNGINLGSAVSQLAAAGLGLAWGASGLGKKPEGAPLDPNNRSESMQLKRQQKLKPYLEARNEMLDAAMVLAGNAQNPDQPGLFDKLRQTEAFKPIYAEIKTAASDLKAADPALNDAMAMQKVVAGMKKGGDYQHIRAALDNSLNGAAGAEAQQQLQTAYGEIDKGFEAYQASVKKAGDLAIELKVNPEDHKKLVKGLGESLASDGLDLPAKQEGKSLGDRAREIMDQSMEAFELAVKAMQEMLMEFGKNFGKVVTGLTDRFTKKPKMSA